jgi:predicted PurR-regulated permease PerM
MPKRTRTLVLAVLAILAGVLAAIWWTSGPQIIGKLPREDLSAINSLLGVKNHTPQLFMALRHGNSDALADWLWDRRDGRLLRLEVQSPTRVLAFLTSSLPAHGRLLTIDKSDDGWKVSDTNNSVTFR